jgi:hypothetical protein
MQQSKYDCKRGSQNSQAVYKYSKISKLCYSKSVTRKPVSDMAHIHLPGESYSNVGFILEMLVQSPTFMT